MDLLRRSVIAAGRLEGLKARLLLAVLLARNASIVERAAMFAAYGPC
jgi:L-asparaginase/Glu-tRNA(Gln) amidotransferase subunit D